MKIEKFLVISLMIIVPMYVIGSMILGGYFGGSFTSVSQVGIYNMWIWCGMIVISLIFISLTILMQRDDLSIDSVVIKALVMPSFFYTAIYLLSYLFPHSWKITDKEHRSLPDVTIQSSERYQVSEIVLQVGLYSILIIMMVSIVWKVIIYLKLNKS
ncbi:hypothetical protein [Alkalibacillus aidingensis]|uniref:hypothetical protein n=1 Tax=Alkalibacillus aidingensis TaxID=2747607 RepID=UPI001661798B|nr:hypothetical protein [Alkalibacillus aidingensis]